MLPPPPLTHTPPGVLQPPWSTVNITNIYTAKMRATIDVCSKTVEVTVYDITSKYISAAIPVGSSI